MTDSDIHRLKKAGMLTVNAVVFTLKKKLLEMEIRGITESKADLILVGSFISYFLLGSLQK